MKMFDFDKINDRHTAGDIKYEPVRGADDVIPMWVADMDFRTAPCVETAIERTARKGIYGYQSVDDEYRLLVRSWYSRRFSFEIGDEWILPSPAVMHSIACVIRALTDENDAVLVFEPVYYPFSDVIRSNRRRLIISNLKNTEGYFEIDFDDFEKKITENDVKAVLFCSPHNPVGRVWKREELLCFAEICENHELIIISDEIHSDLVYTPHRHVPIASLSESIAMRTVTCVAPTKTFNLAAIEASNIIIPNDRIRLEVRREMQRNCLMGINTFGIAATKAVYTDGEEWLDELLLYLDESRRILSDAFPHDGRIFMNIPEGTYLAWLDCRGLGLSDEELYEMMLYKAGVRLHKGSAFGTSGTGFMRLNFACPHSVLVEAIERILRQIG